MNIHYCFLIVQYSLVILYVAVQVIGSKYSRIAKRFNNCALCITLTEGNPQIYLTITSLGGGFAFL